MKDTSREKALKNIDAFKELLEHPIWDTLEKSNEKAEACKNSRTIPLAMIQNRITLHQKGSRSAEEVALETKRLIENLGFDGLSHIVALFWSLGISKLESERISKDLIQHAVWDEILKIKKGDKRNYIIVSYGDNSFMAYFTEDGNDYAELRETHTTENFEKCELLLAEIIADEAISQ